MVGQRHSPDILVVSYTVKNHMVIRTLILLFASVCLFGHAYAEGNGLLPKYGPYPKNEAQKANDQKFIAEIDSYYQGDRKKGASEIAMRGWQLLRQGDQATAMRRFNQAWLLDSANGKALWGMGAIWSMQGHSLAALALFLEAKQYVGDDIDFSVDYAKALGIAGAESKNAKLLESAFVLFEQVYDRAPQHTINLQNWAITHFYVGNYAEAWKRIKLAEATPRKADIDPRFISALQEKMPRP